MCDWMTREIGRMERCDAVSDGMWEGFGEGSDGTEGLMGWRE